MENNTLGYWVWFLIVGGMVGWLAGMITRGQGFGIPVNILIGIVGAILGGWLSRVIGISIGGSVTVFLMAIVGAVILVILTRFFKRLSV
ncbi:MAG: GlsB/YeaQ/YmgE family stress response membrane protein [Syntrophaceae bacterium]|nr:GlsB/YeaQ/YmgE family stress response membrane protein [Syntrophaceae bacterium]